MSLGDSLSSKPWLDKEDRVWSWQQSCFTVTFCSETDLPKKKPQTQNKPQNLYSNILAHLSLFKCSGPFPELTFISCRFTEDRELHKHVRTCSGSSALKCSDFVQPHRSCWTRGSSSVLFSLLSVCILETHIFSHMEFLLVTPQLVINLASLFMMD